MFGYAPCAHDCIPLDCIRSSVKQLCSHYNKLLGPNTTVHYAKLTKQLDEHLVGPDKELIQVCVAKENNVVVFEYDARLFYICRFTAGSHLLVTANQDPADSDAFTLIEAYMHRLNHNTVNVSVTKFRPPPENVNKHATSRMLWQIVQLSIQCQSIYNEVNNLPIPKTQCSLHYVENLKTLMAVQYFDSELSNPDTSIEDTPLLDERNFIDEINNIFLPIDSLP
jgi:hypothetical protein